MIKTPSGIVIKNFCISTAFGHAGSGMFPFTLFPAYRRLLQVAKETGTPIFTKSSTRHERVGNFIMRNPFTWKYVHRIHWSKSGIVNAYGLTNPGVEVIAPEIRKSILEKFFVVYPNFFPEFAKGKGLAIHETLEAILIYRRALGSIFRVIELNYSCPNSGEDIQDNMEMCGDCTREVKRANPDIFLIVKIGYDHPYEFAQEQERAGADALHAINTIPFNTIFPNDVSPLAKYGKGNGGVSGGPAKMRAYEYNKGLRKKTALPLIFGCGVESLDDYHRYMEIGADVVSGCSLAIRREEEAIEIIEEANG